MCLALARARRSRAFRAAPDVAVPSAIFGSIPGAQPTGRAPSRQEVQTKGSTRYGNLNQNGYGSEPKWLWTVKKTINKSRKIAKKEFFLWNILNFSSFILEFKVPKYK